MQYKFFVDREWRHDEHQPYVSGEYGVVNTVFLASVPNEMPISTPQPQVASGSSMDVDNVAIRPTVRVGLMPI